MTWHSMESPPPEYLFVQGQHRDHNEHRAQRRLNRAQCAAHAHRVANDAGGSA